MPDDQLQTWRARGAARWDAVHFGFVEALARRVAAQQGQARLVLERRLQAAIQAYARRFAAAEAAAASLLAQAVARHPAAADALTRLHAAGALDVLEQQVAALDRSSSASALGQLVARAHAAAGSGAELRAVSRFGGTWARLGVERQLSRSLARAPAHAGPLNSHALILRALTRLRELSPAYLNHFVAHVDALLWIEHRGGSEWPAVRKAAAQASSGPTARAGAGKRRVRGKRRPDEAPADGARTLRVPGGSE